MMEFDKLPKHDKLYVIESFSLSEREEKILKLKYIDGFDYPRIAAEMNISVSSVGRTLTRVREHVVEIAKHCYPLADDKLKHLIDVLGWCELDSPVIRNRRKK